MLEQDNGPMEGRLDLTVQPDRSPKQPIRTLRVTCSIGEMCAEARRVRSEEVRAATGRNGVHRGNERFQRVLSIIVCLGLFLMPCCAPAWYDRWRRSVLVGFRWVLGVECVFPPLYALNVARPPACSTAA